MCHSGEAAPLGLRLDSYDAILKGSTRGPVVKSGAPSESELIRRIKGISQPRMPMTGPPYLSDTEIATFERWVSGGLSRAESGAEAPPSPSPAPSQPPAPAQRPGPGENITWLHVAPIFATRCAKCHTDNGLMGSPPEELRLTSYASTLESSERARVVPGNPDASELVRRIRGQAKPRMPFDGPPFLDSDEIRLIEDWIAQGARDAAGVPARVPAGAKVRLHGTLERGDRLDGLELAIGPHTRIDKSPGPGDYVQVRGRLDDAGNVIVERLRRR
jgi:mono/diheme cytochrome c family protein